MDVDHGVIAKQLKRKWTTIWKIQLKIQLAKKRPITSASAISNFFGAIDPYKKILYIKKTFVEFLGLLIIKKTLLKYLVQMFNNAIVPSCCFPF